ncbi:MAG: glycosyltransferase [Rubrimonas sp.]
MSGWSPTAPALTGAPRRVLLVGNFDRRGLGRSHFNTEHKLLAGFLRLGHGALAFSDRDVARESSLWGRSRLGAGRMNAKLVETARHYRPHLVVVFHCDLVAPETYAALRGTGARLAQVGVDSTDHRPGSMTAFRTRAELVDLSFLTTACPEALRRLSPRPGSVTFLPNPVDEGVETARVFDVPRDGLALDALFLGSDDGTRPHQVAALRAALPPEVRFRAGAGVAGGPRLTSTDFLEALASSAQGLNLPVDHAHATPFLYSSNRIAQLLGQGTLTHVHAPARLQALYEDGVVPFEGPADLAENILRFARDDAERRRVAERGWRIARARTGSAAVAGWVLAATLGEEDAAPRPAWPTERW